MPNGITVSPHRATSQRMGREKRTSRYPQRMFLGKYMSRTILRQMSGSSPAVGRLSLCVT